MKVTTILCAILLAITIIYTYTTTTDNQQTITTLRAQIRQEQADAKTGAKKAFKAGVNACTTDDIAIFNERADKFDNKANNATSVLSYYLYLYCHRIYTNLAQNWGYDDDALNEMYDDFIGTEVSYQ